VKVAIRESQRKEPARLVSSDLTAAESKGLSGEQAAALKKRKEKEAAAAPAKTAALSALRCLCELLKAKPTFNLRDDIIAAVVNKMPSRHAETANVVGGAVTCVFEEDVVGETSFAVVNAMMKMLHARSFNVNPAMIECFEKLNLKDVRINKPKQTAEGEHCLARFVWHPWQPAL
jgi:hypothetical protein